MSEYLPIIFFQMRNHNVEISAVALILLTNEQIDASFNTGILWSSSF